MPAPLFLTMIPWFDVISIIFVGLMMVAGQWPGKGTGWDIDKYLDTLTTKAPLTTTTTTTMGPFLEWFDPEPPPVKKFEYSGIALEKLPNDLGLIINEKGTVCFPKNNWIFGVRFEPNEKVSTFTRTIDDIEKNLDKFKYKLLDGKAEEGDVEITKSETGEKLYLLKRLLRRMKFRYHRLKPLFKAMARSVKTQIPHITTEVLRAIFPQTAIFAPGVTKLIDFVKKTVQLRTSSNGDGREWLQEVQTIHEGYKDITTEKLEETVQQLTDISLKNLDALDSFQRMVVKLLENRMPVELFGDLDNVKTILTEIRSKYEGKLRGNIDEDLDRMFTMPLTYAIKKGKDENDETADYNIYTILPLIKKNNEFTIYELDTVPIQIDEDHYRQYLPQYTQLLVGKNNKIYINDPKDYQCLEQRADDSCKICFITKNPKEIVDKCTTSILGGNLVAVADNCPYSEEPELNNKVVRVGNRNWAYFITKSAKLSSDCGGNVTEVDLPLVGIVSLPNVSDCSFTMTNGPFEKWQPYVPDLKLDFRQIRVTPRKVRNMIEKIKHHFHEHSFIYIIAMLTTASTFFIISFTLLCFRLKCNCLRRMKRNRTVQYRARYTRQRENLQPLQNSSQLRIIEIPQEARASWEITTI